MPGSNLSDLNNIDGFVVKLTDTTGGVITNPLGGNPVASAGSTTATSTPVAPSTPVAVGVLSTEAVSAAGVNP